MEGPEQDGQVQRRHVRIPVDAKVDLVYDSFASFISDYVSNVSRGGMFIATTQVRPPGTRLTFELRLRDDYPLIRGRGEVVWVRRDGSGDAERATGMAVRFLELDQQSAELIERMVEQHRREGGAPFDVEGTPAETSADEVEPATEAPVPPPAAGAGGARLPFEAADEAELELDDAGDGDVFAVPAEPPAPVSEGSESVPSPPVDVFDEPEAEPDEPEPVETTAAFTPPAPVREELPPMEPWPDDERAASADEAPAGAGELSLGLGAADEGEALPPVIGPEPEPEEDHGSPEALPGRPRRRRRWPFVAAVVWLLVMVAAAVALWQRGLIEIPFLPAQAATPLPRAERPSPASPTAHTPPAAATALPAGMEAPATPSAAAAAPAIATATPLPATPTPVPVVPPGPATAVEAVRWQREGTATVLRIVTNGRLSRSRLKEYRLENPPRQVVRITGITKPFEDRPLEVDGPLLARVRVGYHPEVSPPELHVVVDLANDGVRMDGLDVVGADVVVRFVP